MLIIPRFNFIKALLSLLVVSQLLAGVTFYHQPSRRSMVEGYNNNNNNKYYYY